MNINTKMSQSDIRKRLHFSPAALAIAFAGAVSTLGMANNVLAETQHSKL